MEKDTGIGNKGNGKALEGTLPWLRQRNRRRVLDVLREQGRISQADIARRTGLSRSSVSTLIQELKEAGQVSAVETRARSEERRVGKECRSRWSPYH